MPKKTFYNLPYLKKNRIMETAMDIFIEEEYESINIRDMVKRMGISIGSFYKYFDSKDELYLFLMSELDNKIYQIEKKIDPSYALIRGKILDVCPYLTVKEHYFLNTWYSKAPLDTVQKYYFSDQAIEMQYYIKEELLELKEAGKLKDDLDIDLTYYMFVTTMFSMVLYFKSHNITDANEIIEFKERFFYGVLLHGIFK